MDLIVLVALFIFGMLDLCCTLSSAVEVKVEVIAPVNPVEEDGIFSLRCQVWNLGQDQEVSMVRIPEGGKTERLALREDVVSSDERMFLAVRQLEDSSLVYFLSIMRIQKADAGEYRCSVYGDDAGSFVEKTSDKIHAEIMYFPDESQPKCKPEGNIEIMAGTELILNCSSEAAFPTVTLTWSKGSSDAIVETEQITQNGETYSLLKLNPTQADSSNVVYLCTVTSSVFPEETSSCHIGPLTIHPNPNLPTDNQPPKNSPSFNLNDVSQNDKPNPDEGAKGVIETASACAQECSYTNSSAFYWVVATIIAAILAVAFFIIGIIILLRYCRLQESRKADYTIARQRNDQQIYAELDSRRGEKVYMYLDKNPKVPLNYTSTPNKELQVQEHYGIIPHVPKV